MNKLTRIFRPFSLPPKNKIKIFKSKETTSKGFKLLSRYGIIHQCSTGMYHILPMGQRVIEKIVRIVDNNMRLIGAQKMTVPLLSKKKLWEKSETYDKSKEELYKVTDRGGFDFILSPTHEQSFCNLLSEQLMSYKSFPLMLYQIMPKFRDEHRAKLGLLRSKEFLMKDLYSFDIDSEAAETSYDKVTKAYEKIFNTLGIDFSRVESLSESGIQKAHEYYYMSEVGDDRIYKCPSCKQSFAGATVTGTTYCPGCSLYINKDCFTDAIEIGHTFSFGTHYSDRLGSCYVDINCQRLPLHLCSYGIGITRLLSASVELLATDEELRWPFPIAPYSICIIPPKDGSRESIEIDLLLPELYQLLEGIPNFKNDILLDDRGDMTIGKRFLEAKLFGFPFIVVAGKDATQRTPLFELHDVTNGLQFLMPRSSLLQYLYDKSKILTEEKPKISYITT